MRLAVITDEISQDLEEALAVAAAHRFDAVEIRSVRNRRADDLTARDCAEIGSRVAQAGLQVAALSSGALKRPLPETRRDRRAARDCVARACEQARILGAPLVRVFSFYRADRLELQRAAASVADALPVDGDSVPAVAIENGTRTHTPTGQLLAQLLAELGRGERVGAVWDPGNSVFSGFDATPFPAGLIALWADLLHVHVKDPCGRREYVRVGCGDVPWPEILATLHAAGFPGYVSLETHWRIWRPLTARLRDEPAGAEFSAGGRMASELCMATIRRWSHAWT